MSLIARILLTAFIGAIGAVAITLWASSVVLSRYWVATVTNHPPPRIQAAMERCDQGQMPTAPLRFGQRTVEFYARDSLAPARPGAPAFPAELVVDARAGAESGIRLGGLFGGGTVGYHRLDSRRCGVAVIRLVRSPLARSEVQTLGILAALFAAFAATSGAYLVVARPILRRVAVAATAAELVGSSTFTSHRDEDWSDLAQINHGLSTAHDRIMANEQMLAGRAAEIEQLLSAIAHDLKTPLAIIQLILQRSLQEKTTHPDIGRAMAEIQHINALLENLELGAQLRSGDLVTAFSRIDLAAIVADSAARFTLLGESLDIAVEAAWPDGPLWVHGDAVLFNRILSNLVHNALRHSGGKHVALWIAGDSRWAHLRIIDDGIGLPMLARKSLVDPADSTTHIPLISINNHGRGLPIVRQLCNLMNVEIEIEEKSRLDTTILLKIPLIAA